MYYTINQFGKRKPCIPQQKKHKKTNNSKQINLDVTQIDVSSGPQKKANQSCRKPLSNAAAKYGKSWFFTQRACNWEMYIGIFFSRYADVKIGTNDACGVAENMVNACCDIEVRFLRWHHKIGFYLIITFQLVKKWFCILIIIIVLHYKVDSECPLSSCCCTIVRPILIKRKILIRFVNHYMNVQQVNYVMTSYEEAWKKKIHIKPVSNKMEKRKW